MVCPELDGVLRNIPYGHLDTDMFDISIDVSSGLYIYRIRIYSYIKF